MSFTVCAAEREAEDLVPEADAEDRQRSRERAHVLADPRHGRRIAGTVRQEDRRRAGARAPARAVVEAGTTVTSKPCSTSRRTMLRLMPKS